MLDWLGKKQVRLGHDHGTLGKGESTHSIKGVNWGT